MYTFAIGHSTGYRLAMPVDVLCSRCPLLSCGVTTGSLTYALLSRQEYHTSALPPLTPACLVKPTHLLRHVFLFCHHSHLQEASQTYLSGILGFEERPLVSTDYINDMRSGIVDAACTQVIDGTMVKIYAWCGHAGASS